MADYWIKLYIEIIDDPKMATLPDRLWRRTIELYLLAGRINKDGELPPTNQIAWALRSTTDEIEFDLSQLSMAKLVEKNKDGWFIPNFAKRQAAASDAERKRQQRDRSQRNQYYGNDSVTDLSRIVTQNRTETETETEQNRPDDAVAAVYTIYSNNIGLLTPIIAEKIDADIEEYAAEWVIDAIKEAARQEKRSLAYAEAILKRWKREGKSNGKQSAEDKYAHVDEPLTEDDLAFAEQLKRNEEQARLDAEKYEQEKKLARKLEFERYRR